MRNFLWHGPKNKTQALILFFAAVSSVALGAYASVCFFPGGFDWQYRVISSLASQVDNPQGYGPFCFGISASFAFVFALAGFLENRLKKAKVAAYFFRVGSIGGILVGLERGLVHNLSSIFYKAHEAIALIAFFGIFFGVLGFALRWWKTQHPQFGRALWVLFVFIGPFAAAAASQLLVYLHYRHLGWVTPRWRELGVPVYLSFAFWQWIASIGAYASMGVLCLLAPETVAVPQEMPNQYSSTPRRV